MTFLEQVADYYIKKAKCHEIDLTDYTFVLPNKRSSMFLRKYLKKSFSGTGLMPKLLTITSFTQNFCEVPLTINDELIFILYNSYCKVMASRGVEPRDFESFIFWGLVVLNDFNDVDSYLANAQDVFTNLHRLKEIEANYLTPEQQEVARILGDRRDFNAYGKDFWAHMPSDPEDKETPKKFINLWEIMGALYQQFQIDLKAHGVTYTGMQQRIAYETIKGMGKDDFKGKRFVFIGFYVLSTSRFLLFEKLKNIGVADFFWDTSSPLINKKGNQAGVLIDKLAEKLPKPEDFNLETIESIPDICVYPVTSLVGQAKACSAVLEKWRKETPDLDSTEVGVIVPTEKLLTPVIHSIPESYFPVNIAMKVPMRTTPMASLLTSIIDMHERANGSRKFFYKDVLEVLSNPYITMSTVERQDAEKKKEPLAKWILKVKSLIFKNHLYTISPLEISQLAPPLEFLFKPIANPNDYKQVKECIDSAINGLYPFGYETEILDKYKESIDNIIYYAEKYRVDIKERSFLSLLRRMIYHSEVHINGTPVWGLQVMNFPDSRVLDFNSLAILAFNEGIFPPKNFRPSFIPPTLRIAYCLPTFEEENRNLSYLFFRLISRAKRLAIFYDNRTPDLSSGEKSRFISQLQMLVGDKVKICQTAMGMSPSEERKISVEKTPEVLSDLDRLINGDLNFSASAFKTYLKCPLCFYLQYVKRLRIENFDPEYMDASSYGRVLHKVAEDFYKSLQGANPERPITPNDILQQLQLPDFEKNITNTALDAMAEIYYGNRYKNHHNAIPGEGQILAQLIARYIRIMFESEAKSNQSFYFVSGEDDGGQKTHKWKVNNHHIINFTMSIDRIDSFDSERNSLRFIDYKTGKDIYEAKQWADVFDNHDNGCIFQLLLYSIAYTDIKGLKNCSIKPMVYKFLDMSKKGTPEITINKVKINDVFQTMQFETEDGSPVELKIADKFRSDLTNILDNIFSPDQPFNQTENIDNCKYCAFAQMCGRSIIKDN